MKITIFTFVMLFAGLSLNVHASPPLNSQGPTIPTLHIDPSSTTVSFGKAGLTVNPLIHKGKFYVGDYQLNVVPYFFMSEKGALELEASDDTVHKLMKGVAAEFTGKATNTKRGKPKTITGKAMPSSNNRGSVTFSVETDNGPMIFNSSYHFGE